MHMLLLRGCGLENVRVVCVARSHQRTPSIHYQRGVRRDPTITSAAATKAQHDADQLLRVSIVQFHPVSHDIRRFQIVPIMLLGCFHIRAGSKSIPSYPRKNSIRLLRISIDLLSVDSCLLEGSKILHNLDGHPSGFRLFRLGSGRHATRFLVDVAASST